MSANAPAPSEPAPADPQARELAGAAEIARRLGELLGEAPRGELQRLSSGASRATYTFDTDARGPLVLQVAGANAPGRALLSQADLLSAAAQAGVPVAAVVEHGPQDNVLGGEWIVMQAVAGTSDPKAILGQEGVPAAGELLDSIAAALAAVHRMPAEEKLAPAVDQPLAQLRATYDSFCEPHPVFELAFAQLGRDRAPARRTFVHGDFRMGNLLVADHGVSAVLDWELCHLGDPVEDLGWLCVPAWRFSRPDLPAAGLGTREQLRAAYERHAGHAVQAAELARWELAGTLRWGVICMMQAFKHLSGAQRSVELAVIGRRACEVEWDLLELLDPVPAQEQRQRTEGGARPTRDEDELPPAGDDRPPPPGSLDGSVHDRPAATELLDAARGALAETVLPEVHGRAAFELRVAMRAIAMVGRELAGASQHALVRAEALARLGAGDEAQLCELIRNGAFEGRRAQLCASLRELVRAKLEVANPRYLHGGGTRS
jgi:aminoglycoside phosphotransferase (APT) family kinase protein